MKKIIWGIIIFVILLTTGLLFIYFDTKEKNSNQEVILTTMITTPNLQTDFNYQVSYDVFKNGMEYLKNNPAHDKDVIDFLIKDVKESIKPIIDLQAKAVILSMYRIPERFPNFTFIRGTGYYTGVKSYHDFNIIAINPDLKLGSNVIIHELGHFLDNFYHLENRLDQTFIEFPNEIILKAEENLFNSTGEIFTFYKKNKAKNSYLSSLADILKFLNKNRNEFKLNNGKEYFIADGHDVDYYSKSNLSRETVANFFELKVANQIEVLELIRKTLGNEYYNYLDNYYYEMLDTFAQAFLTI